MRCQINYLHPQLLQKRIPIWKTCFSSQFPNPKIIRPSISCCQNNLNDQTSVSTATVKKTQIPKSSDAFNVKFKTLGACKLGISRYPDFEYNADGGSGSGTGTKILDSDLNGEVYVDFDVQTLYIPPLSTATTKFLGLPLPPFLKIEIFPEVFHGKINQDSGKVDLKFKAKFCFSFANIYKAPPLLVETVLTSDESQGKIRRGKGERMKKEDDTCRLVGVAVVQPINDLFMDTFLSLPTECLADLNASISFSDTS